jgi:hypothetical protein
VLGPRPTQRRERELWDRAADSLARYRVEHGIEDRRNALGERPREYAAAERYDQARSRLDSVQRELGVPPFVREMPDAVILPRHYVGLLGESRAARLELSLPANVDRMRALSDEQLRELAAEEERAVVRLDRQAAQRTLRVEREHAHHQQIARSQSERAASLEDQASRLGWRARQERTLLRRNAAVQLDHAARHLADVERLELELSRLSAAGRHPDQWLEAYGERVATAIAAKGELALRRHRAIEDQVRVALVAPPAHVCELIGERPISDLKLARDWERLAGSIERHRLSYELDIGIDGPLGPEPTRIAAANRHAYESERNRLVADIERYRETRGLHISERTMQSVCKRERDEGLGRDV